MSTAGLEPVTEIDIFPKTAGLLVASGGVATDEADMTAGDVIAAGDEAMLNT